MHATIQKNTVHVSIIKLSHRTLTFKMLTETLILFIISTFKMLGETLILFIISPDKVQ